MEQVLLKKSEPEFKLEVFDLEEVPVKPEFLEEEKAKEKQKSGEKQKAVKNALLKLLKKGNYNVKYLEGFLSPDAVKRTVYYRNYGNL